MSPCLEASGFRAASSPTGLLPSCPPCRRDEPSRGECRGRLSCRFVYMSRQAAIPRWLPEAGSSWTDSCGWKGGPGSLFDGWAQLPDCSHRELGHSSHCRAGGWRHSSVFRTCHRQFERHANVIVDDSRCRHPAILKRDCRNESGEQQHSCDVAALNPQVARPRGDLMRSCRDWSWLDHVDL